MTTENTNTTTLASKPKKPRVGSIAWEATLWDNPTFAGNMLPMLVASAKRGSKEAAKTLEMALDKHPELRPPVRQLDDLITRAENAWVAVLSGSDKLAEETVRKEIETVKAELHAENPTILDRMLVGSLVVSYLAHQRAVIIAAKPADTPAVTAMRDRRAESAQKRMLNAIKALTLIRAKKAKGHSPPPTVKLFTE